MLDYRRAKLCNSCANVCESNTLSQTQVLTVYRGDTVHSDTLGFPTPLLVPAQHDWTI